MKLTSLSDLFAQELKDMYSAENQLVKALPKMAKATTSPELQSAFQNHLEQTKEHVSRLEEVCRMIGASPKGKKCVAMEGLIEEGSELLNEKSDIDPEVLNAALIAAAQKVEHYEIASYGTLRSYAERLGQNDAVNLLQRTLDEEGETDKLLTTLSQQINPQATTAAHDGR